MVPYVEYLGHKSDTHGLHLTVAKVEAIKQAPVPKDFTQLKSFLGLVNYYSKFSPNLATTCIGFFKKAVSGISISKGY